MPLERRTNSSQLMSVVMVVSTVGAIALLIFLLIRVASSGDGVSLRLGDDTFGAGPAARRAESIRKSGIPLLFSDVSGRGQQRPIFLQHEGDDPKTGWFAFDARTADAPKDCFLEWDATAKQFRGKDACVSGSWPANGAGLHQYHWSVNDDGNLIIDLREKPVTTTTTG
jgi:hypothetical protein